MLSDSGSWPSLLKLCFKKKKKKKASSSGLVVRWHCPEASLAVGRCRYPTASTAGLTLGPCTGRLVQPSQQELRALQHLGADAAGGVLQGHTSRCESAATMLIAWQLKHQAPLTSTTTSAYTLMVPVAWISLSTIHTTMFIYYCEGKNQRWWRTVVSNRNSFQPSTQNSAGSIS